MVETLIKNGRVYDGTGSDWFGASVAIEKAKVQLISGDTSSLKAKRVIDATGKIVCPGFVDMHAHSTMVILKHPEHEPKVRQGVTTELIGVDGNSYAPFLLGDYPSPRSYGTFPKVLGDLVRDEGLLSMADAIRKITSLPAQRLGLQDRGILRNGFAADLVVFDPLEIHSPATLESPRQFPLGISHVMVNGVLVIDDGEHTGALPGRVLRNG